MICDTNFLSELHDEHQGGFQGRAVEFLRSNRRFPFLVTVISLGELAVIFPDQTDARKFLSRYNILRLTPEVAYLGAAIERELRATGKRLGENDNWIAAFCRYYGQPLISLDAAFDRVRGLRRLAY